MAIGRQSRPGWEPHRDDEIEFASTVPAAMRADVESLFFFNPQQSRFSSPIKMTVEKTGVPLIFDRDNRIWIGVKSGMMQCLFACGKNARPVGVALFSRPEPELVCITHLAVDPQFEFQDENRQLGLAVIIVGRVREIARSIKGVSRIQLPYRNAAFLRV